MHEKMHWSEQVTLNNTGAYWYIWPCWFQLVAFTCFPYGVPSWKVLLLTGRFSFRLFPQKTLHRKDFSRTGRFPDNTVPWQDASLTGLFPNIYIYIINDTNWQYLRFSANALLSTQVIGSLSVQLNLCCLRDYSHVVQSQKNIGCHLHKQVNLKTHFCLFINELF